VIARPIIWLIRVYQFLISPLLGNRCRFYPSCSHYAAEAFSELNIFFAIKLVLIRLSKCHPFHPGGFDPIPVTTGKKHE